MPNNKNYLKLNVVQTQYCRPKTTAFFWFLVTLEKNYENTAIQYGNHGIIQYGIMPHKY